MLKTSVWQSLQGPLLSRHHPCTKADGMTPSQPQSPLRLQMVWPEERSWPTCWEVACFPLDACNGKDRADSTKKMSPHPSWEQVNVCCLTVPKSNLQCLQEPRVRQGSFLTIPQGGWGLRPASVSTSAQKSMCMCVGTATDTERAGQANSVSFSDT
jgi:hypothetical protein